MKIKAYQVVDGRFCLGPKAYYSLYDGNESEGIYCLREVEVEVPDLPDEEFLKSFVEAKKDERKQMEIAALKERLAKLEAGE